MADAEIIPLGTRGRPGRGSGSTKPSRSARNLAGGSRPAGPPDPEPTGEGPEARDTAEGPEARDAAEAREVAEGPEARAAAEAREAAEAPRAPDDAADSPDHGADAGPDPDAAPDDGPDAGPDAERAGGSGPRPQEPAPGAAGADQPRGATRTEERPGPDGIPVGDWLAAIRTGALEVFGEDWEAKLATMLAFWRRRLTGDYTVDEYGFDQEMTEQFFIAALRPLAEKWFRVEVRGAENIPADGGALMVSNHSGTLPLDGLMTGVAIFDHTGRHLRPLGADLVFRLPVVGEIARRGGATLACSEDAERMLRGGEIVGVWPEGFKGIGKPYSQRYKLQRFGRGGFVSAAIRTGVPIVPCSVVGAEEIYPLVGNMSSLARLLGVPYVPVTPLFPWLGPLGLVPLPSKWLIEFGEPIRTDVYDDGAADDPMLVFNVTDQVRETIQQTLYSLLMQRRSVFG